MEKGIEEIDFEAVDSMVQVHGEWYLYLTWALSPTLTDIVHEDYEGVSMSSRDANSKQAASEASSIFQNHYPEFLVSHNIPLHSRPHNIVCAKELTYDA